MLGLPIDVRVGGVEKSMLLANIRAQGIQLNRAAELLFEDPRFVTSVAHRVVRLRYFCVSDLGYPHGAIYPEIVRRAEAQGCVECPLELGPHLRLQFLDQAEGGAPSTQGCAPPGSLTIASVPLDTSETTPKGFYLRRVADVLWLRGYWSPLDHIWGPGDRFVFALGDSILTTRYGDSLLTWGSSYRYYGWSFSHRTRDAPNRCPIVIQ